MDLDALLLLLFLLFLFLFLLHPRLRHWIFKATSFTLWTHHSRWNSYASIELSLGFQSLGCALIIDYWRGYANASSEILKEFPESNFCLSTEKPHQSSAIFFFFWLSKSYHRVFGSIKSFQIDLIRQTTTSLTEPSAILSWMFTFKSKVRWKMHFKWRPRSTPPSFKQNFSNGQNYGNNGRTEQIYGRSETIKITAMFEGITFSVLSYKTTESWWNWGASN